MEVEKTKSDFQTRGHRKQKRPKQFSTVTKKRLNRFSTVHKQDQANFHKQERPTVCKKYLTVSKEGLRHCNKTRMMKLHKVGVLKKKHKARILWQVFSLCGGALNHYTLNWTSFKKTCLKTKNFSKETGRTPRPAVPPWDGPIQNFHEGGGYFIGIPEFRPGEYFSVSSVEIPGWAFSKHALLFSLFFHGSCLQDGFSKTSGRAEEGFTVEPPRKSFGGGFSVEWFGLRLKSQSYKPKVRVAAGQTPESESNCPEKEPEWGSSASAENPA